jgi:hypothetical protein
VRAVSAALLAMLRTALALRCVSKARDWAGLMKNENVVVRPPVVRAVLSGCRWRPRVTNGIGIAAPVGISRIALYRQWGAACL